MPLHFSDEEKDLLLSLAQPLDQKQRAAFLAAVAAGDELRQFPEILGGGG
jgi:hypothetical protein